jgi:small GTP-binding protein
MGNLVAQIASFFNPARKLDVLICGLGGAGKTTLINTLMHPHARGVKTVPTIKCDVKTFKRENVTLQVFDMGGQEKYRENWPDYAEKSEAIVYVVDSSDKDTIKLAGEELRSLLEWKQCEKKPLLVLLNKVDLPHISPEDAQVQLELHKIDTNPYVVMPLTATNLASTVTVLEWLKKNSK